MGILRLIFLVSGLIVGLPLCSAQVRLMVAREQPHPAKVRDRNLDHYP